MGVKREYHEALIEYHHRDLNKALQTREVELLHLAL
jgi:hypothetical protein